MGASYYVDTDDGRIFRKGGKEVKYVSDKDGYLLFSCKGKWTRTHRFIYETANDIKLERTQFINHIDFDVTNNKISNLEVVTNQQNQQWRRESKNNTSGCKGVSFIKSRKKWQVSINIDKKPVFGGYFVNFEDAVNHRSQLEDRLNKDGHKFYK